MSSLIYRFSLAPALLASLLLLSACVTPPPQKPSAPRPAVKPTAAVTAPSSIKPSDYLRRANFSDLPGWTEDDLRLSWPALLATCQALGKRAEWQEVCRLSSEVNASDESMVRRYYETQFVPHQVRNLDGTTQGTATGYYEPLLRGARSRMGLYQTALYRVPDDLLTIDLSILYPELKNMRLRGKLAGGKVLPYSSRAELMTNDLLAGKEIVWVDNPIDAFFLQVQGSGRVVIEPSGEIIRLAYADQNGHPYRSIGRYLVDRGELSIEQASMQGIKAWYLANPTRRDELLNANPSFVFFKEEKILDSSKGPKGSLGVPLTPQRSIAIDPQFVTLGAPVFLSTTHPKSESPLQRLVLAQDTGGAIRNPVRADFFWGFGDQAGELAGRMKQSLIMWVLLPHSLTLMQN
ncbi:MAG: MltA domain-containing protein [Oxalobacteraceae bacterium]|nr:MltA domain-containing protein [Oxalobacteraceae bacterium]